MLSDRLESLTEKERIPLSNFGVEVTDPSARERDVVRGMFETVYLPLIKRIYKIDNPNLSRSFSRYVEEKNIKDIRLLFHGSRKETWLSICEIGLRLTEAKNGSYGKGHYFSSFADVSCDFTEREYKRFIGVFDVAYGKPYTKKHPSVKAMQEEGCNCIHAPRYQDYDEIVVYDDRAAVLRFLVEME